MLEAGLALGGITVLSLGVWAWSTAATQTLLLVGLWLVVGGLAFGLPTGLLYHVELRRCLLARGLLPARWWLHPIRLHPLVPPENAFRVMAWCQLGALGCGVAFLGCGVFALGALRLLADG